MTKQNLPFATSQLDENHELVWDDGVAPEVTLDFDAPHVSIKEALLWWGGGLAFFAAVFGTVVMSEPESKREAVPRSATLPPTAYDPRNMFTAGAAEATADAEEEEEEEEEEDDE